MMLSTYVTTLGDFACTPKPLNLCTPFYAYHLLFPKLNPLLTFMVIELCQPPKQAF